MLQELSGGVIANLASNSFHEEHLRAFREIVKELQSHYRLKLDQRRFTEITINGGGWTSDYDRCTMVAILVTAGMGRLRNSGFDTFSIDIDLKRGNWLYIPKCQSFTFTSGREKSSYPLTFVTAHMLNK